MKWKGKKRYASNFCGHLGWRGGLILGTVEMCWSEGKPPIVCGSLGDKHDCTVCFTPSIVHQKTK